MSDYLLDHLKNPKPKVAMLGTYLALYDDAFPDYGDKMRSFMRNVSEQLEDELEIVSMGSSTSVEEAKSFIQNAEKDGIDALVLFSLGYTNSLTVTPALIETSLPLVFFNTQSIEEVKQDYVALDLQNNHGMQGVQDITAVLAREGRLFQIVTGLASEPETKAELIDYLIAYRASRQLKKSRMAAIEGPQAGMGDMELNRDKLKNVFGIQAFDLTYENLAEASNHVTQEQINEVVEFDSINFELDSKMTLADHERSIKLEIGMRNLALKHKLSGLTFSFDQAAASTHIETIPFLGIIKLMGEGVAYGGEGDQFVTAGGIIARCLCDEVNFTEMYTMDFKNNAVLNSHMAEGNWRMGRKDRKPEILCQKFTLAECPPFLSVQFGLEPGDVTLFNTTMTPDGKFHFITLECRVEDFPPLKGLNRPSFKLGFNRDLRKVLNDYSLVGGTHHLSLVYGHHARRFKLLAEFLDCKYTQISNE